MSHFAAFPGGEFSVKVQFYVGHREGSGPIGLAVRPEVAEEVCHGRRAEELRGPDRQVAYGPQLLFELACDARVEGQVARIVRTRRKFIDHQPATWFEEELDAENPYDVQLFQDGTGNFPSVAGYLFRDAGGRDGYIQYVVVVTVFKDAPISVITVAGSGGDDRDFAFEGDEFLENGFNFADRGPCGCCLRG